MGGNDACGAVRQDEDDRAAQGNSCQPGRQRNICVFAISFAVLLLELLLTRVFSVVMYHHFSFLAVSLAMTGLGLGGLIVNQRPSRFREDNVDVVVPALALAFALSVLVAIWVAFHTAVRLDDTAQNWQRVALVLALCVVPFTLAGLILAHILAFGGERIPRLYFFDLLGAACACLMMVPLTGTLGAPSALLAAAAVGVASGATLARRGGLSRACALLALLLSAAAVLNARYDFLNLRFVKGGKAAPAIVTRWNSFSRVEVLGTPADLNRTRPPVSWGFSSRLSVWARELYLLYDGEATTQIVGFDGDLSKVNYLLWDVTSAAHHTRVNPDVLVIGTGGGRDVLAALAAGTRSITGIEINEITVGLMRNEFRDYSHGLYTGYPGVAIHNEEGRSFVRRTTDRYDLIQASLVDTWAASSAGAYALTENSLYTVEAFSDYLERLKPDGLVSFSRWYTGPPAEVVRTVVLAREALRRLGVADPRQHLAIVRTDPRWTRRPSLATILVKRSPFVADEVMALRRWSREMLFDTPVLPPVTDARGSQPAFDGLLGDEAERARFTAALSFDISPTTDDRPFFFDRVPLLSWLAYRVGLAAPVYARSELSLGGRTLLVAVVVTSINALLLLSAPLLFGSRSRDRGPRGLRVSFLPWIAYFGFLGLGYIAIEIVLIQRFQLFLGKPSYALSVVLFSMLSSSALGALMAERRGGSLTTLRGTLGVVIAVVGVLALGTGSVVVWAGAASEPFRVALTVLLVAPVGFVMGMPFPMGLRHVVRLSPALVSWAWAVNGGMSVLGSVLAVIASMTAGFTASLTLGWLSYAGALAVVLVLSRGSRDVRTARLPA
jgi:hypothetical protein